MAIIQLLNDGTISINGLEAGSDATNVSFTPQTLGNWTGSVDPGQADDAFDQLASRIQTLEGASGGGGGFPNPVMWLYEGSTFGFSGGPYGTTEYPYYWQNSLITDVSYFPSGINNDKVYVQDSTKDHIIEGGFVGFGNASLTEQACQFKWEIRNSGGTLQTSISQNFHINDTYTDGVSMVFSVRFTASQIDAGDYFVLKVRNTNGLATMVDTLSWAKFYVLS